jgi:hypothetical protein
VAVAADEKIVWLDVAMDVAQAVDYFEREKQRCSVEFGGVMR